MMEMVPARLKGGGDVDQGDEDKERSHSFRICYHGIEFMLLLSSRWADCPPDFDWGVSEEGLGGDPVERFIHSFLSIFKI